ncbi:hypothetical protein NQ318_000592 [Aromia moschata]|uniref:Uncharacterized protein n=1 Tax=Aromia moschata TaxID=1265417 RepID=A0AAV8XRT1_9CUCU|nr:hypothetical protein NQ318_000592 [Aromia moschata]
MRRHSIASIAAVGVVCMAPVIPKQASICSLPSFAMAPFFLALFLQLREPYVTMGIITWECTQRATAGFNPHVLPTMRLQAHRALVALVAVLSRQRDCHGHFVVSESGKSEGVHVITSSGSQVTHSTIWKYRDKIQSVFENSSTMMPDKTMKFKGGKCIGGKLAKERLIVLVAANMTGSEQKLFKVSSISSKIGRYSLTYLTVWYSTDVPVVGYTILPTFFEL